MAHLSPNATVRHTYMYVCVCVCDVSCFCASLRLLTNIFEWGKHQMRQSSCHCRHWPRGQAAATTKNQRKFSGKVNKFLLVCFHSLTASPSASSLPPSCLPFRATKCLKSLAAFIARNGQKWPEMPGHKVCTAIECEKKKCEGN